MKKFLYVAAATFVMLLATEAKAQMSIAAGLQSQSEKSTFGSISESLSFSGLMAGAFYNVPSESAVSFTTGLYFSYLTCNDAKWLRPDSGSMFSGSMDLTEWYINVPLNFRYNYEAPAGLKFFAFAGPVLRYALSSEYKAEAYASSKKQIIDRFADGSNLKRYDFAAGGGIGLEFAEMFQFSAGYKVSVLNRSSGNSEKVSNGLFTLTAGYMF